MWKAFLIQHHMIGIDVVSFVHNFPRFSHDTTGIYQDKRKIPWIYGIFVYELYNVYYYVTPYGEDCIGMKIGKTMKMWKYVAMCENERLMILSFDCRCLFFSFFFSVFLFVGIEFVDFIKFDFPFTKNK